MKKHILHFMIPLTLFLFIAPGLIAQQQNEEEITLLARNINKALTEPGRPNYNYQDRKKQKKEIADYYRHHKALSADYEGYVIELTTSDLPLKRDYFLFEGMLTVLKLISPVGNPSFTLLKTSFCLKRLKQGWWNIRKGNANTASKEFF